MKTKAVLSVIFLWHRKTCRNICCKGEKWIDAGRHMLQETRHSAYRNIRKFEIVEVGFITSMIYVDFVACVLDQENAYTILKH